MTGNYIMCHYLHIIGFEQWELAVFWQVYIHPSETLMLFFTQKYRGIFILCLWDTHVVFNVTGTQTYKNMSSIKM